MPLKPPPNPKANEARADILRYYGRQDEAPRTAPIVTEPTTQAELNAYVAASARHERVWSAIEQKWYDAITYTLFDKKLTARMVERTEAAQAAERTGRE